MSALDACLARDARYRHLRVVPQRPKPAPVSDGMHYFVPLDVLVWFVIGVFVVTPAIVYAVGVHEGARMERLPQYVEPVQWAQFGFRGGFDAADDVPRWSEISL